MPPPKDLTELESLEGWLIKKKRADKVNYFGGDTRRWFKIQKISGSSTDDLALCYFSSANDKEAKGWVYMKDILDLADDGKIISIGTTTRKLILEAQTRAEHRLWLQGILDYSPCLQDASGVQSDINLRRHTQPSSSSASSAANSSKNGAGAGAGPAEGAAGSKLLSQATYSGNRDFKGYEDEEERRAQGQGVDDEYCAEEVDARNRAFSRYARPASCDVSEGSEADISQRGGRDRGGTVLDTPPVMRSSGEGGLATRGDGGGGGGGSRNGSRGGMRASGDSERGNLPPSDDFVGDEYAGPGKRQQSGPRGGGGGYGGSATSRLHSHISKNNNSAGGDPSNPNPHEGPGSGPNGGGGSRSHRAEADVECESLGADRLEPARVRLQRYGDDGDHGEGHGGDGERGGSRNRDSDRDRDRERTRSRTGSEAAEAKDGHSSPARQPVSHFANSSNPGGSLSSGRDLKLSVEDMISRAGPGSSGPGSARAPGSTRGKPPPMSSYSPSRRGGGSDEEDDEDFLDLKAEKERYMLAADGKDSDEPIASSSGARRSASGSSNALLEEKHSGGMRPPLPSTGSSSSLLTSSGSGVPGGVTPIITKGAPPASAPPPSRYSPGGPGGGAGMHTDNNFVVESWDDDDGDGDRDRDGRYGARGKARTGSGAGSSLLPPSGSRASSRGSVGESPRGMPTSGAAPMSAPIAAPAASKNSRSSSFSAGVKEDANWLDENFD